MALPRFGRRTLAWIGLATAVPALVLAALGVQLTLRVVRDIRVDSQRFNAYIAEKITEAFERELLTQVREAIVPAERVARAGGGQSEIMTALAGESRAFEAAHFVTYEDLNGSSLLMVDAQPLVYGDDPAGRREHPFAAILLTGATGDVIGAGGWWFNPRAFLSANLQAVVLDRITNNPRTYGGMESTRDLCVTILDGRGNEVSRVREGSRGGGAATAAMTGPFEGFTVRVSPTRNAPVALAGRFIAVEVALIALMTLGLLFATWFGLRYTLRQIELVQMKTSFVSNVTHELKTPIAVIRLASETLEMKRFRTPEEGDKVLRTIVRETERLSQLVDNILDFSRLEAGQQVFRFGPVRLSDVVEASMDGFRLRLEDAGFQWSVDVPEGLPAVKGDANALQHCLLNLLDNAVKYSRQVRELRIWAASRDGDVTLSVSDKGLGIDPADQRRIFEKFARVETGLVHDVKGAGLGLSLVDQIIRAHHGRIELASAPGQGSTFTLVLPQWNPHGRDGRNVGSA